MYRRRAGGREGRGKSFLLYVLVFYLRPYVKLKNLFATSRRSQAEAMSLAESQRSSKARRRWSNIMKGTRGKIFMWRWNFKSFFYATLLTNNHRTYSSYPSGSWKRVLWYGTITQLRICAWILKKNSGPLWGKCGKTCRMNFGTGAIPFRL